LEAGQQFWRVGYFVYHYFHPNTPLLAAQDMHVLIRNRRLSLLEHG
jgi:hypothetical protein